MKKLLDSLLIASEHLSVLDEVFRKNYGPYRRTSRKLENLRFYDDLRKEIYAGGKKEGSLARQMILGDLLQYIFTGRGYYFAVKGKRHRIAFTKIIYYVCNLLIIMEDCSVDVKLRNVMLDTLKSEIGEAFFEDEEQKVLFKELRKYKGYITPGEGDIYDNTLDSMLPKRVGAIPELLVYAHLVRKNYGYVVSLLHSQKLLGNPTIKRPDIAPPDYLLLRSKGEIFGIEVGGGKEPQIGAFSTLTSIPVFTATIGTIWQPQPFRCGKCQRWIEYCDEVINLCSRNEEPNGEVVDCSKCTKYSDLSKAQAKCPNMVYYGRAHDHNDDIRKLRYHYHCVEGDSEIPKVLERARTPKFVAPIPWVSGLGFLSEEKY